MTTPMCFEGQCRSCSIVRRCLSRLPLRARVGAAGKLGLRRASGVEIRWTRPVQERRSA